MRRQTPPGGEAHQIIIHSLSCLYPHIFTTKKINNNTYSPSQINERQSSQDTCTLLAGGIVPDLDDTVNILSVLDFVVVAKEVHVPTIPPPPGLALLERLPREDTDRGGGGALQCKHVPTTVSSSSSSISSMAFNKVLNDRRARTQCENSLLLCDGQSLRSLSGKSRRNDFCICAVVCCFTTNTTKATWVDRQKEQAGAGERDS